MDSEVEPRQSTRRNISGLPGSIAARPNFKSPIALFAKLTVWVKPPGLKPPTREVSVVITSQSITTYHQDVWSSLKDRAGCADPGRIGMSISVG